MAQLMKRTLVFGAGVAGLATLTQTASADTETKHFTLEEVKAENAKRLATYETEKREIDERNRVKRAQYRDAYAKYAEFAERGGVEPQEPEYEALPTLELLEEPIELPFDVNDATPVETVANDVVDEVKEDVVTPETKETGAKEVITEVVTPEVKETGTKEETTEAVTSETKETGAKEETTSESKETGEKTSSDAVAAQLEGEKTSSDAVAAQLKQTSEETTSSSDAAAQVNKIEAEKTTETTTQSETPTETTSSADAAAQVAKLEAEKSEKTESNTSETTTTQSDEVETTTNTPTTTSASEKSNENKGIEARGAVTTTEETTNKEKSADSLPHTGDAGGLMSLMGVALSGLGGVGLRRKRK